MGRGDASVGVVIAVLTLALLLTSCEHAQPVKSVGVTAYFEGADLLSGGSTILVVDAMNNGTQSVNGTFSIGAENDHATVELRHDVLPTLRQGESAGQKRYNVSARAQSTSESIRFTVNFTDSGTNEVLGSKDVFLSVHK